MVLVALAAAVLVFGVIFTVATNRGTLEIKTFGGDVQVSILKDGKEVKVVDTKTGNTVRLLSRYRPDAEIIALSPDPRTLSHMTILAHVRPIVCRQEATLEDMLDYASRDLSERGLVEHGEQVVFVAGVPPGVASTTNVLKLHRIGDPIKLA